MLSSNFYKSFNILLHDGGTEVVGMAQWGQEMRIII